MTTLSSYSHGQFSWVDLMAHDLDAAAAWYAELFGWTPVTQDTQGGPPYVMFQLDGHWVAGAGQMGEDMKGAGAPAMWNNYIAVDDCAATEAKARELGGTVTVPTMKVMDTGTMAFICDPGGANFGIWQAGTHHGAGLVNVPGAVCWNELGTRDLEGTKRFYSELFGWDYETDEGDPKSYTSIKLANGRENGGMMSIVGAEFEGLPSHWMGYFAVETLDEALARVERSGGKIHLPATPIPQVGTFSVVSDPQGAVFTLIEMDELPD